MHDQQFTWFGTLASLLFLQLRPPEFRLNILSILRLNKTSLNRKSEAMVYAPKRCSIFMYLIFFSQENAEHRFGFLSGSSPVCISVGRSGAISTHFEAPADGIYTYKTGYRLL